MPLYAVKTATGYVREGFSRTFFCLNFIDVYVSVHYGIDGKS